MATVDTLRDPREVAESAGLPESVGNYAQMLLERLDRSGYGEDRKGATAVEEGVVPAAVVYIAARDEDEPVTVDRIADAAGVDETPVAREYKRILSNLGLDGLQLVDAREFISRFGDDLDLGEETVSLASSLYEDGQGDVLAGRSPAIAAALCLYAAGRLTAADLNQTDFEEFGVSEISVRKGYGEVLNLAEDDGEEEEDAMTAEDTDALLTMVDEVHAALSGVPDSVHERARELARSVEGASFLTGKDAAPVAAAIYWLAARDHRLDVTQGEVADAARSHKVTVNRRVSDVRAALGDGPLG